MEFRLDKEGKEFHHFEEFAKMYRAEVGIILRYLLDTILSWAQVKSLTRTLEQLQKHGATIGVPLPGLPGNPMKENLNGPR